MALFKVSDRYPEHEPRFVNGYRMQFADSPNIRDVSVYTRRNDEKIGSVHDLLADETGRLRYLVLDMGFWIFGKKVLLPIGRCIEDPEQNRIYVEGLTKEQVEHLPAYHDEQVVDSHYEERVRSVYRMASVEQSAPVEQSVPVEQASVKGYTIAPSSPPAQPLPPPPVPTAAVPPQPVSQPPVQPEPSLYDRNPDLYTLNDRDHQQLRLYEERLVADKHREKTGEVKITKRIETEPVDAAVPIQKEKVVIEVESVRSSPQVNPADPRFQTEEVSKLDLYEERADIHKEAVVHQEVTVRKEVVQDVVIAHDTVRREELDVQQSGSPDIVDRPPS